MTVVELVVVLVLTGILAAFVIPRFVGTGTYSTRAAQDRLIATARYAQQLAMNKGPGNTVQLVLSSPHFRIDVNGTPVVLPMGSIQGTLSGVTTNDLTVTYTPLGGTSPATITVMGTEGSRRICIEATGYAHAC